MDQTENEKEFDINLDMVIANASKSKVRTETMNGEEYYVSNATIMLEGVHNGSAGAYLYNSSEMSEWPELFDGKPVTIDHIKNRNGKFVTRISKEILERQGVGVMMNTAFDNNELTTETWINKKRINKLAPKIEKDLLAGKPIEVSIGIRARPSTQSGVFRNSAGEDISYKGIVKNVVPSHLAILTNEKGACSCAKGCGINNAAGLQEAQIRSIKMLFGAAVSDVQLSFSEIASEVADALRERFGTPGVSWYGWIVATYPDYVIFSDGKSFEKYFMLKYSMVDGEAVLDTADPTAVERVISYVPCDDAGSESIATANSDGTLSFSQQEVNTTMPKKDLIDTVIANGQYDESQRSDLEKMDEASLSVLSKLKPAKVINNCSGDKPTPMTEKEWMENAPPRIVNMLNQHAEDEKNERAEISEFLLNSEGNVLTQEDIDGMSINLLRKTATTVQNQVIANSAAKVKEEKKDEEEQTEKKKNVGVPIGRFSAGRMIINNAHGTSSGGSAISQKLKPEEGLGGPSYAYTKRRNKSL